jgi:hypothetical protein
MRGCFVLSSHCRMLSRLASSSATQPAVDPSGPDQICRKMALPLPARKQLYKLDYLIMRLPE